MNAVHELNVVRYKGDSVHELRVIRTGLSKKGFYTVLYAKRYLS